MSHPKTLGLFILLAALAAGLAACGDESGESGLAGTWEMDVTALKEAAREAMEKEMEGKDGAMAEMMRDRMDKMLAAMDNSYMRVEIAADGNWTGESVGPSESTGEREKTTSRGTWSLDGDQVAIVTTHRGGEVAKEPETVKGVWDGDVIRVSGEGSEPDIVMRRK